MRTVWNGFGLLTAVLLGLAGCHAPENFQPPKTPEVYAVPPADDPRFSKPPALPANLLNQDRINKGDDGTDAKGGPGGVRAGGGMRPN